MNLQFRKTETGFRLFDEDSGKQFGELFQESMRHPAWKSSNIVYEKYKRKYNLEHNSLIDLANYALDFYSERIASGKKCTNDFLTQKCSEYINMKQKELL